MNEKAKGVVTAIGALAEICGELKRRLIQNGLTEAEALYLVEKYMIATVTTPTENKEDK